MEFACRHFLQCAVNIRELLGPKIDLFEDKVNQRPIAGYLYGNSERERAGKKTKLF